MSFMDRLAKWFGKGSSASEEATASPVARVSAGEGCRVDADDSTVTLTHPGGELESVGWAEVRAVAIEYRPNPPFEPEICYLLEHVGGKLAIPADLDGEEAFVARLQALPGFDSSALKSALATERPGTFTCWKRR